MLSIITYAHLRSGQLITVTASLVMTHKDLMSFNLLTYQTDCSAQMSSFPLLFNDTALSVMVEGGA